MTEEAPKSKARSPWERSDAPAGPNTQVAEVRAHYDPVTRSLVTADNIRLLHGPGGAYMEDPRDLYEIKTSLGRGSYGSVVSAVHKRSNTSAAIKIVNLNNASESDVSSYEKEIRLLQDGGECPFIVHLIETYRFHKEVWIIMEYCEAGSLEHIMRNMPTRTFDEETVAAVVKMLALGLLHMHKMHKIHRDIKPANILVNAKGEVKIADFGLSTILTSTGAQAQTLCGTPYYVAPEICRREAYNYKADIWSLGMLAYFMLTVPAFIHDRKPVEVMELIRTSTPDHFRLPGKPEGSHFHPRDIRKRAENGEFFAPNAGWNKDTLDFLKVTLQLDPARRWSAEELMMHPFIFRVPRAIRRQQGEDGQSSSSRVGTVVGQEGSMDFVVLRDPKHGAWPVYSNYRPDVRNLGTVLSRDDLGFGASRVFMKVVQNQLPDIEANRRNFEPDTLARFNKRELGPVLMYTRGQNDEAERQAVLAQRAMMQRQ